MRIVNISSLYPPNIVGGAEQGLKVMSDEMVRAGHDVHIITLDGPKKSDPATNAVQVHPIPLKNLYWPFDQQRHARSRVSKAVWHAIDTHNGLMASSVKAALRDIAPDVVLTRNLQGFSTAVMPAVKSLGLPLVHVIHDFSLLCPQTSMFRNGKVCGQREERCRSCRLLTPWRWRHTNAADAVIGVSRAVVDAHVDHGLFHNAERTVIYNALKPSLTIKSSVRPRDTKRPIRFGFLGRVEKAKGVDTLLEAMRQLSGDDFDVEVVVAGKGDPAYIEGLKARYAGKPVSFAGYVDTAQFFSEIDALVFPSELREALGNGVFEAFSQGLPVIGSTMGGIPESIEHEKNGMVFEAGNVAALADCMRKLGRSESLRASLAEAALVKSHEYQPAKRVSEYIDFLSRVVAKNSDVAIGVHG